MNDWIKFKGRAKRSVNREVYVSLDRRKELYLSSLTIEELREPKAMHVFFDEANRRIGLKPAPIEDEDSLRIRYLSGKSAHIALGSFCREFGIVPECRIAFQNVRVNADGIMVLDLQSAKSVGKW